ncbi:MAG: hypothetical protein WC404_05685, partial [Candidatus Omnitrophota bacterium]
MCTNKKITLIVTAVAAVILSVNTGFAFGEEGGEYRNNDSFQERFSWWPTDAQPAPVKDEVKGGYWWWPTRP